MFLTLRVLIDDEAGVVSNCDVPVRLSEPQGSELLCNREPGQGIRARAVASPRSMFLALQVVLIGVRWPAVLHVC